MRWIKRREEFDNAHGKASACKYIDSGRYPTALKRWVFDDAQILTVDFAQLLQQLIGWSADAHATYVVLNPDPIYYFWHHFEKYPAVELEAGDSPGTYLSVLSEDPGSPADAIGTNWCECVVVPPSNKWFVHALRHDLDSGGHLWIPAEWNRRVNETYPFLRSESPQ
jgi:hypothetical protein